MLLHAQLPTDFIQCSGEGGVGCGGDILVFALGGGAQAVGWPANPKQEYMRDPPGMVKETKQGSLELTNVKELHLDSMEQAEGKTAFPHPCLHANLCAIPLYLLIVTTDMFHVFNPCV